jgi:hypothetical protein
VINFRKIGIHVRKPVDHLVTTSARRTRRTLTRIILRPLSALLLDEGLNSPCDKKYILDGNIQKAQTCVLYHMTYDSIVMT